MGPLFRINFRRSRLALGHDVDDLWATVIALQCLPDGEKVIMEETTWIARVANPVSFLDPLGKWVGKSGIHFLTYFSAQLGFSHTH